MFPGLSDAERIPLINGQPMLTVELVPKTAWWSNVRSNVTRAQWEVCKNFARERAGGRCEVCRGIGRRHAVECHEVWLYDDEQQIQTLGDLIALCPPCHEVKHIGRAMAIGTGDRAFAHLMKVNDWPRWKAERAAELAFEIWNFRSEHQWALDISYLETLGIRATVTDR